MLLLLLPLAELVLLQPLLVRWGPTCCCCCCDKGMNAAAAGDPAAAEVWKPCKS
jgi:hypothetical protein